VFGALVAAGVEKGGPVNPRIKKNGTKFEEDKAGREKEDH
jgi:hypothetical protein